MRALFAFLLLVWTAPLHAAETIDIAASDGLACALYRDGAVYCFGSLPGSGLELPLVARKVEGLPPATAIAVGRLGACAVDRESRLWCWGIDVQRSIREDRLIASAKPFLVEGLPPVVAVDAGYSHFCAIGDNSELWCWGDNPCGEVGCGHNDPVAEPKRVPYIRNIKSVSAGVNNTCAVSWTFELLCWGTDNPTMFGVGREFIFESNEPLLLKKEYFGLMSTVSNGRNFACGIRTDGQVTCWGSNIMGQLGTKTPRLGSYAGIAEVDGIRDATDLDTTYFGACAVEDGVVVCWGEDGFEGAQSRLPTRLDWFSEATAVAMADAFTCAVDAGEVYCWGSYGAQHDAPLIEGMTPDHPVRVPGLP